VPELNGISKQFTEKSEKIIPNNPLTTVIRLDSIHAMYCTKCGVSLPEGSVFCSKCGAKLSGSNDEGSSEQGFTGILQKLVKEQGKDALIDAKKCKAFISDYTGSDYKKERRFIVQAVEAGAAKAIAEAGDLASCKKAQVRALEEEYGLTAAVAADIVDTLALVLRGDASKTQTAPPAGAPPNPPPESAIPHSAGRFCLQCGAKLGEGLKFCTRCGTPFQTSDLNVQAENKYTNDNQNNINKKQVAKTGIVIFALICLLQVIASFGLFPISEWMVVVGIIAYLALYPAIIILVKNKIIKVAVLTFLSVLILTNLTRQLHILPDGEWIDFVGIIGVVAIITGMVLGIIKVIKTAKKDKNNV
jgi:ribosomal protein L40E